MAFESGILLLRDSSNRLFVASINLDGFLDSPDAFPTNIVADIAQLTAQQES